MIIRKTAVMIEGGPPGTVPRVDTIEHDGKLWLVPIWAANPEKKLQKPVRIVCLSLLPHSRGVGQIDYVLELPLPKSLFERDAPKQLGKHFVVVEAPDIEVPMPPGSLN